MKTRIISGAVLVLVTAAVITAGNLINPLIITFFIALIAAVAVYELLFVDDMETNVSISEAVKIAQEYSTKEDVAFVNGVLSSAAKSLA